MAGQGFEIVPPVPAVEILIVAGVYRPVAVDELLHQMGGDFQSPASFSGKKFEALFSGFGDPQEAKMLGDGEILMRRGTGPRPPPVQMLLSGSVRGFHEKMERKYRAMNGVRPESRTDG